MGHKGVNALLVTGGGPVVKQAMGCGKKVWAAGPGNPPTVVMPHGRPAEGCEGRGRRRLVRQHRALHGGEGSVRRLRGGGQFKQLMQPSTALMR